MKTTWVGLAVIIALTGCGDDSSNGTTGGSGGTAGTGAIGGTSGGGGIGGTAGTGAIGGTGGVCADNDECSSSDYCEGESCRGDGECMPRPTECALIIDPVCGCDFETYGNACEAAAAGVRVSSEGECPCFSNADCEPNEFCEAMYACAGEGECVPRPESCAPMLEEVCGCDDADYGNACEAAAAGVRVSALGTCDCSGNDDCDPDSYCNALTCDGPGVCEVKPILEDCPNDVDRVIVCNGNAFENPCRAAAAGQRIDRDL